MSFILEKPKGVASHAFTAYPERALREAVVNAFYHRSYEVSYPDPVKIHVKPEFIDIISYPGRDPTLKPEHFSENKVPPVQHRNRRMADFLKSLKLAEGMYTGVGTIFTSMKENKNPKPQFDFGPGYFRVRLPGHPKYIVQSIRGRVDYLCAKGNEAGSSSRNSSRRIQARGLKLYLPNRLNGCTLRMMRTIQTSLSIKSFFQRENKDAFL